MVVPFQSVMIPMVKVSKMLGLLNSIPGVVVIYFGFGMPLTVFLLHGFVKGIPKELEESAYIDGCSTFQSFFHIVFPLMRTMVVTVIILQTLWIWNDFLLPLLVLFGEGKRTIPLGIFSFFGQYLNQWDSALATLIMGMIPIIIFFLILQNYIIRGITAGSVKS
jgi:raffinose/stachyose/melibiose transport system permease protein